MARSSFSVVLNSVGWKNFVPYAAIFLLVLVMSLATAAALSSEATEQSVALGDLNDLLIKGGQAEPIEYQGRKAIRLTTAPKQEEVLAFLKGAQIQDGTIECDIALKITTPLACSHAGICGSGLPGEGRRVTL